MYRLEDVLKVGEPNANVEKQAVKHSTQRDAKADR